MARDPKFMKRQKERARQEKQAQKAERRAERKASRDDVRREAEGQDPDIAGIVPGPQAPLWERMETPTEAEDAKGDADREAEG